MITSLFPFENNYGEKKFSPISFKYCYVGFVDNTEIRILRWFLKHGFRHCFILMGDEEQCIVIDPVSNRIEVSYISSDVRIIRNMFMRAKICVSFVRVRRKYFPSIRVSSGIFTCVEVVKRVLGISKFSIFTPFRLYQFLKK